MTQLPDGAAPPEPPAVPAAQRAAPRRSRSTGRPREVLESGEVLESVALSESPLPAARRCGYSQCSRALRQDGRRPGWPRKYCPDRRWPGGKTCKEMAAEQRAELGAGLHAPWTRFAPWVSAWPPPPGRCTLLTTVQPALRGTFVEGRLATHLRRGQVDLDLVADGHDDGAAVAFLGVPLTTQPVCTAPESST